ncbi:hypothetical protein Alg130_03127 [Pyrenophora tritici-repentis]|uniref:Uncharacterized protein n=1 Tax=Pyrenophora tritici-repentis TaxID=45151 RepID=A0A5M9L3K8_9PLEO|nr:hypothetical protein PtrV1_09319 [Pyrenophora tritici-repentis]KAF7443237.1 hypothetical protein A1F99_127440 [Pyrenophora tritici-repentis]KAF7568286.1 hypothetical protein PtrM4_128990 [Pyrenophora tritici-repentis]KAI0588993.1 hypothetical protein Alg130_03127 [Pyrenophora tritici-repentis]KAI0612638.1 hypothetical protein TUN205_03148 [Pyrenophora tritici-repentis]
MLDDYILDPDMLVKKCPLDHGRHYTSPRYDLGVLHILPTEL